MRSSSSASSGASSSASASSTGRSTTVTGPRLTPAASSSSDAETASTVIATPPMSDADVIPAEDMQGAATLERMSTASAPQRATPPPPCSSEPVRAEQRAPVWPWPCSLSSDLPSSP
eukprot:1527601-Pyramimonas_sp.AAC.1